jgi:hypothetical protein
MQRHRLASLLAAVGACVAAPAFGQDRAADVERQFGAFEAQWRGDRGNLTRLGSASIRLRENAWQRYRGPPLEEGGKYMFVGFCDQYCTDLNLEVFEPWGQVVGSDFLDDANPIVTLRDVRTGTYTFRGVMKGCSQGACLAEVRVYRVD